MFNKFPFHRILVLFTLFSMSLTACNAAPTLTAPESTPVPTATNTPRPTETPTEVVRKFSVDALTLSPELTAALKKHAGLETSITLEANGRYTAAVSVLNTEGAPEVQTIEVAPAAMTEDLTTKNKYGDTPVMTTVDGKKLYWIQEEKAWFAVEISPDIHAPVLIPYGKIEIPLRVTIVEFPEAFSQEAVEFWKKTPGLFWEFTYLVRNALTGESTKFGYLRNRALGEAGLTVANSPVQYLDSWFAMDFPDGTRYEFSPTKWLDPDDPRNPKGDEWKIIFAASGPEIMGDENNRNTYDNLYTQAAGMRSR